MKHISTKFDREHLLGMRDSLVILGSLRVVELEPFTYNTL
jgi:hypothetical protein